MPEIKVANLSLNYKKQEALKNISFTIKENTICGLLGRNGAGKTSLMGLLASFRPATSGQIFIDGQPVFDNANIMPQVALVGNRNEENNSKTVEKYLAMASNFRPNWDSEYAAKLLDDFAIPSKKHICKLSLGAQSTVRSIAGLASRAPITLYDEAYQGMDAAIRSKFIQEILDDYMRFPRTIIFSTHYIGEVENIFEEVIILSEGRLLAHESCESLQNRGIAITGNATKVDKITADFGWQPLNTKTLGTQKEIMLFSDITDHQRKIITQHDLSLTQPSLQDLFIHITDKESNGLNNKEGVK